MGTKYSTSVVSTLEGSGFWELATTTTQVLNGSSSSLNKNSGLALLNKKAVEYPTYTDSNSMKTISEPTTTTLDVVSSPLAGLTTTQRSAYKLWYEKTYCNGVVQNWSNVEVHHIKPRQFGGTHDYSNLVPLDKTVHTKFSSWWINYNNRLVTCE